MKKNVLFIAMIFGLSIGKAQYANSLYEDFDGVSPCQTSWSTIGAVTYTPGDDFTSASFNLASSSLDITSINDSNSTPLYYALTDNVVTNCGNEMGKGRVEMYDCYHDYITIKARATANTTIQMYIQEGNSPSLDYSRFSESVLKMNLTTSYQVFEIHNISKKSILTNSPDIDLTNIGALAFEAKDGNASIDFTGKIQIDFIRIGIESYLCNGVPEITSKNFYIEAYPSPAKDILNINFSSSENAIVSISDVNGKVVSTNASTISDPLKSIDISNYTSGLYFINVTSSDGVAVNKFVVE
jgi:hypothetical protein